VSGDVAIQVRALELRVLVLAGAYVDSVARNCNTDGDFWTLADAVADLKKARRARQ
jgi:hypothetical protein